MNSCHVRSNPSACIFAHSSCMTCARESTPESSELRLAPGSQARTRPAPPVARVSAHRRELFEGGRVEHIRNVPAPHMQVGSTASREQATVSTPCLRSVRRAARVTHGRPSVSKEQAGRPVGPTDCERGGARREG